MNERAIFMCRTYFVSTENILEGGGLRLGNCAYCLWKVALDIGLGVSCTTVKEYRRKQGKSILRNFM